MIGFLSIGMKRKEVLSDENVNEIYVRDFLSCSMINRRDKRNEKIRCTKIKKLYAIKPILRSVFYGLYPHHRHYYEAGGAFSLL